MTDIRRFFYDKCVEMQKYLDSPKLNGVTRSHQIRNIIGQMLDELRKEPVKRTRKGASIAASKAGDEVLSVPNQTGTGSVKL